MGDAGDFPTGGPSLLTVHPYEMGPPRYMYFAKCSRFVGTAHTLKDYVNLGEGTTPGYHFPFVYIDVNLYIW